MKYIVITRPEFFVGEAAEVTHLFECGLERLHLRKPGSAKAECRRLLDEIPAAYHPRIVLHDHYALLADYNLCGPHLNARNPVAPAGWTGHVSTGCHSFDELRQCRTEGAPTADGRRLPYTYIALSPIYDSTSKAGYRAAFTADELRGAQSAGLIDHRVMALGGIRPDRIEAVRALGFGGVMVLGDAWQRPVPSILSIAGSDPSGGAGIQQDLRTATCLDTYAATVITALTVQNTQGVQSSVAVDADLVEAQLRAVFSDLRIDAVKIGMVPSRAVAERIVTVLSKERTRRIIPVVYDPVMVSTSGASLMAPDCVDYVIDHLLPLVTLLTPNLPEHALLLARCPDLPHRVALLVKGGHATDTEAMTDVLTFPVNRASSSFTTPRITTPNLHGTGCTLSTTIAAGLAHRHPLATAVAAAKDYVTAAILAGRDLHVGHGNGPLGIPPRA